VLILLGSWPAEPAELHSPKPCAAHSASLVHDTVGSPEHCKHQHGLTMIGGTPQTTSPEIANSLCPVFCVSSIRKPAPETFFPGFGKQSRLWAPPSGPGKLVLNPLESHDRLLFGPSLHVPSRTPSPGDVAHAVVHGRSASPKTRGSASCRDRAFAQVHSRCP
jgi:hypothetical protein